MSSTEGNNRHDHFFFFVLPGQQIGQGPEPRYVCPRVHVFHPPGFFFVFDFFSMKLNVGSAREIKKNSARLLS
jgi:hypothetical protein